MFRGSPPPRAVIGQARPRAKAAPPGYLLRDRCLVPDTAPGDRAGLSPPRRRSFHPSAWVELVIRCLCLYSSVAALSPEDHAASTRLRRGVTGPGLAPADARVGKPALHGRMLALTLPTLRALPLGWCLFGPLLVASQRFRRVGNNAACANACRAGWPTHAGAAHLAASTTPLCCVATLQSCTACVFCRMGFPLHDSSALLRTAAG